MLRFLNRGHACDNLLFTFILPGGLGRQAVPEEGGAEHVVCGVEPLALPALPGRVPEVRSPEWFRGR